jgi:hypothetical protein
MRDAVVGVGLAAPAAVVAAPIVLGIVGFGSAGIVAGSLAASWMGPATVAGGAFATLQAAGAGGLGLAGNIVLGGGVAAAHVIRGALLRRRNRAAEEDAAEEDAVEEE